jgi:hypothetical protein
MVKLTEIRDNKRKKQEVTDDELYDEQVTAQINEYMADPPEEPEKKPAAKPKGKPVKQPTPPPPPEPDAGVDEVGVEDLITALARVEAKVDAVGNICAVLYKLITTPPPEQVPEPQVPPQRVQQPIRVQRREEPVEKKKKGLLGLFGK